MRVAGEDSPSPAPCTPTAAAPHSHILPHHAAHVLGPNGKRSVRPLRIEHRTREAGESAHSRSNPRCTSRSVYYQKAMLALAIIIPPPDGINRGTVSTGSRYNGRKERQHGTVRPTADDSTSADRQRVRGGRGPGGRERDRRCGRPADPLDGAVPMGHKIATCAIARRRAGAQVRPDHRPHDAVGRAGDWVHSHNLAMQEFHRDHASATCIPPDPAPITGRTFLGYRRAGGRVGTRNYVAVISTVNCSAAVSKLHCAPVRPGGTRGISRTWMAWWRSRTTAAAASSLAASPTPCSIACWPAWRGIPTSAPTCWSAWGASRPRSTICCANTSSCRSPARHRSAAAAAGVHHAGPGGHAEDRGGGRAGRCASFCRW